MHLPPCSWPNMELAPMLRQSSPDAHRIGHQEMAQRGGHDDFVLALSAAEHDALTRRHVCPACTHNACMPVQRVQ